MTYLRYLLPLILGLSALAAPAAASGCYDCLFSEEIDWDITLVDNGISEIVINKSNADPTTSSSGSSSFTAEQSPDPIGTSDCCKIKRLPPEEVKVAFRILWEANGPVDREPKVSVDVTINGESKTYERQIKGQAFNPPVQTIKTKVPVGQAFSVSATLSILENVDKPFDYTITIFPVTRDLASGKSRLYRLELIDPECYIHTPVPASIVPALSGVGILAAVGAYRRRRAA